MLPPEALQKAPYDGLVRALVRELLNVVAILPRRDCDLLYEEPKRRLHTGRR